MNVNIFQKRLSVIVLFVVILFVSLSFSSEIIRINKTTISRYFSCEITNLSSKLEPVVRLNREGLFLYYNNFEKYESKYYFIDFSKLNYDNFEKFYDFIIRNDLINYQLNGSEVIDDTRIKILLLDNDKCNAIYYDYACYDEKLDSLIVFMNSFIPGKHQKDFKFRTHEKGLKHKCR